jgi:hypothetical protein
VPAAVAEAGLVAYQDLAGPEGVAGQRVGAWVIRFPAPVEVKPRSRSNWSPSTSRSRTQRASEFFLDGPHERRCVRRS